VTADGGDYNRLLIIDDDPALGKTLQILLRRAGFQVEWVATGGEGIRYIESRAPGEFLTGVLIDVRLPDMNGLEVLRTAKKINPDAGAVMMTGHADLETALGALNEGAFAYIQKPYSPAEVQSVIHRLAEKQKLIHENRRLLRKLTEVNAELESRVEERTKDLQAANLKLAATIEKLQEAGAAKSDFISMISHELRTPLTVMIGFTRTCVMQFHKLGKPDLLHYLEIIESQGQILNRLIESILDFSVIQRKGVELRYEKFDLRALAASVAEGLSHMKGGARIEAFVPDEAKEIVSDRERVRQILTNLLGNAVKYSPPGKDVELSCRRAEAGVEIAVKDGGAGIPEDIRGKIFEPFYRAKDAVTMKTPGTGLGLTITKALVDALGGRLGLKSAAGEGSTFVFFCPDQPEKLKNDGAQ
jgi:signal transduction histidine kinase